MKKKLLISFSGGRTSAYMTWWLLNEWPDRHNWEMIVVFANTGKEREETLEFIRNCDRHYGFKTVWIECVTNSTHRKGVSAKVVDFTTAARNGEPFEAMIAKHGIPNQMFPHCSRELKRNAIRAYLKQIGWKYYQTAIGIRTDETSRINWANAKKEGLVYPLVTRTRTDKGVINDFWSKQPFDLELKSYEGNCDLCWKKSMRKLMTLTQEKPELVEWWKEMEMKYGEYRPTSRVAAAVKPPYTFFRENQSVTDIVEESKFPFKPAKDESKIVYPKQNELFEWDAELDGNFGCVESCEAF